MQYEANGDGAPKTIFIGPPTHLMQKLIPRQTKEQLLSMESAPDGIMLIFSAFTRRDTSVTIMYTATIAAHWLYTETSPALVQVQVSDGFVMYLVYQFSILFLCPSL